MVSVMRREKAWRSTARARPAGTALSSAARRTSESRRRISSFNRPTAFASWFERMELLHTSSAKSGSEWAGE